MFVATGVGPFSGQAVHFKHFAPEKVPYAHDRYQYEAMRHFSVLDQHLAKHRYMVGDTYTIVDMDIWGWARMIPFILGDDAWGKLPHLKRLFDEIDARPAATAAKGLKDRMPSRPKWMTKPQDHVQAPRAVRLPDAAGSSRRPLNGLRDRRRMVCGGATAGTGCSNRTVRLGSCKMRLS